ncbi:MAG: lysophospholipid acyltransferase family protein [Lachnospiraceae bacterium]|nr:lysophospholipid acyltransferase family protein [Lachnospiraceae bacterium]
MIRLILALILILFYLILSMPLLLIFWLLSKITPRARYWYQRMGQVLLVTIWFVCGAKPTIIGKEKIPKDTAVLFVGNHESYFDVILAYSLMIGPTAFVAKDAFKKIPVLSWNMRFLNCLFIDRENMRQGVRTIMQAADLAKEGTSIFIFPEGTRNKSGDEMNLAPFHDGSFKVAQRGKVPIVPVSFNNTAEIFENHAPKVKSAKVVIEFGDPVAWEDMDKDTQKHVGEHFRQIILDMMTKNRELV